MKALFPTRRVQWVRHETRPRAVEVLRVEQLSPNFNAVTFGGESLLDFRFAINSPEALRIGVYWKEGASDFYETLVSPADQPPDRETSGAAEALSFSSASA